jgi:caffeoyl-CoA O-methyltransferase
MSTNDILNYCIENSSTPSLESEALEVHTRENVERFHMLIGRLEASFLGFLIRQVDAKKVLEIGTFTGYSALAMAEQLPDDGELITIDLNRKYVEEVAKPFWEKSSQNKKIKSIIGRGTEVLQTLEEKFDLIFVDANKRDYPEYIDLTLPLLSAKGTLVIDNCLWNGKVLNRNETEPQTAAIQEATRKVVEDPSLYTTMLPVRDGILLIKKVD